MIVLVWEYLYYLSHVVAGMAFLTMTLFVASVYILEQRLHTAWRIVGFLLLSLVFLMYVAQRIWQADSQVVALVELVGLFCLLIGVVREANLSKLLEKVTTKNVTFKSDQFKKRLREVILWGMLGSGGVLIIGGILTYTKIVPTFYISVASFVVTLALIALMVRRFVVERRLAGSNMVNMYLLLGAVLILIRHTTWLIHQLPFEITNVWLVKQTLDYSPMWLFNIVVTLLLGVSIIQGVRPFLRTRATQRLIFSFIIFNVVIASASAVIFSSLLLNVVQQNQFTIAEQQTKVQKLIIDERLRSGQVLAASLAQETRVQKAIAAGDYEGLRKTITSLIGSTKPDVLRLYNPYGEIVWSYLNPGEVTSVKSDDQYVAYSLSQRKSMQTLSTVPGVLAPQLESRSFYPVIVNNQQTLGLLEVAYLYDNAFVDSIKKRTGSDVTIFVGDIRAATTLTTSDGVSRWIGSRETNPVIVEEVIKKGENGVAVLDQLGRYYYAGFLPLRNVNDEPIAMLSILNPAATIIEETRQRMVITYLLINNASLVGTFALYFIIRPYLRRGS